ncbi:hypothetical protein L7F22_026340 [Adiantum nelumboides]|nr:hypothetical protein [Adiantum nelumboides]
MAVRAARRLLRSSNFCSVKSQHQQLRHLNIHEYQGAKFMSQYGVNVPKGVAVSSISEIKDVLAQTFSGEQEIYEEELLAVIHALESWKHYILGADFIVQTDHQSLRYFLTQPKLSEKHLSWANFLSMFHFQLVHVAHKKSVVANALSRRPHVAAVSTAYQHELDEMRDHYRTDEDFAEPYDALVCGEQFIKAGTFSVGMHPNFNEIKPSVKCWPNIDY